MASDSSASASPLVLTPESTGSSPDPRKTRRQTAAFYGSGSSGHKPVKPFSRSAAKRESVMALGSIEHLQHYFTKAGIASKKKYIISGFLCCGRDIDMPSSSPLEKAQYGLVPAIGGKAHVPSAPSLGSISEFPPPPPSSPPSRQSLEPHVKSYEIDPDCLLPGVCDDLSSVARVWQIDPHHHPPTPTASSQPLHILDVLKSTTRAIRSVRNYLLSLPDEEAGTIRANFRAGLLGPASSLSSSSQRDRYLDPLARIRRSALEVLSVLRAAEEKCRIPLNDEAYDAQSDGGGGSHSRYTSPNVPVTDLPPPPAATTTTDQVRGVTPESPPPIDADASFSYSLVQVNGRYQQIPIWEEEEDVFQVQEEEEEKEKRERWDERLVLAGGWLYKQDVTLSDLEGERSTVSGYLDIVDGVLFEAPPGSERGWERQRKKYQAHPASLASNKSRRVSAGDGEGKMSRSLLGVDTGNRRRVSTGLVDMLQSMALVEEPEEMVYFSQCQEPEEIIEDDLLPEWARRATFTDDDLGEFFFSITRGFLCSVAYSI